MYVRFLPNEYVMRYRKGKLKSQGMGLSFHYFDRSTSAAVIPVSAQDCDFIFEEQTADFQNVSVQGQVTFRIIDHEKIAALLNFSVKLKNKEYYDDPLKKLSKRIINLADVIIRNHVEGIDLKTAVQSNQDIARQVLEELKNQEEIRLLGIEIMGVSILRIKANSEMHRALESRTREEILKESDDALYERRNASIDQERKVKENELNTEITVAEKKKQIKETEVAAKKMLLEKENELNRIRIDSEIEIERRKKELADLKLENAKKDADAEAYRLGAIMEAYGKIGKEVLIAMATANMEPEKLFAAAFEKLAENAGKIGTLNIAPDLLESLKR